MSEPGPEPALNTAPPKDAKNCVSSKLLLPMLLLPLPPPGEDERDKDSSMVRVRVREKVTHRVKLGLKWG